MKLQQKSVEKLAVLRNGAARVWTYVDEGDCGHFAGSFPFSFGFVKNHPEIFTITVVMDDASPLLIREVTLKA